MKFNRTALGCVCVAAAIVGAARGQTQIDLRTQGKNIDFSMAARTRPSKTGTLVPAVCTIGETFVKTDAVAGKNLYICTAANVWTAQGGAVPQTGDYTFAQIAGSVGSSQLPAAGGDVSGWLTGATVVGLQSRPVSAAAPLPGQVIGWDGAQWIPQTATSGTYKLNGTTSGTVTITGASEAGTWTMTLPTSGGSSGQVLQTNGSGGTSWATVAASGITTMTAGATDPIGPCTAPSTSNLVLYTETTTEELWACVASNTWKKVLSTTNSGTYTATGAAGTAPSNPESGSVACYYSSESLTQICLDALGNAFSTVKTATGRTANQFVTHIAPNGIPVTAPLVSADLPSVSTTVNGVSCALGGTCTIVGAAGTAPYSCAVSSASSIACTHNLGTSQPWVACYDVAHNLLGGTGAATSVTSVVATSANVATLTFSAAATATCLITTGSMGPMGADGTTGSQGIQGMAGPAGAQGILGIQGIQGPTGTTGATGAAGTGSGDTSSNTSTSVDSEVVLFSGTNGKVLKRATGTGYLKVAAGVMGTPATIPLVDLPAALKVRTCEIAVGDPGAASSVLADDNDSLAVCGNLTGASLTISGVSCTYYPAGGTAPTISPIITGGAALLTAPLACGSAGTFTVGTLSITTQTNGQSIDANITVAGGTAKYIVIRFGRTL